MGEYGRLSEMAGFGPLRGRSQRLYPPLLGYWYKEDENGVVKRSVYRLRVFLPDTIDERESEWCVYAWPASNKGGDPAYYASSSSGILKCPSRHARTFDSVLGPPRDSVSQHASWWHPLEGEDAASRRSN